MPHMTMAHDVDPAEEILNRLGDISKIEIFNNQALVAIYERPKQTASGIHIPDSVRQEDRYQGKACLLVKMGASAFNDPEGKWFSGVEFNLKDWLIIRPSDGWPVNINGVSCRLIDDINVRGRIDRPDRVW